MLKKLKANKDAIAIGLAILLAIILYGKYIATPFGDYDTWFERIAYGGYDFKQLPGPLQKLDVPVTLSQYAEYREKVVGRLFGSVLPTYAMVALFGERVLGWRITLYLVMFATFWLLYSILGKLRVPYWHRFFCLLFFVILLNRYFFKPISIIIGLSHLFFLIAMLLELNNSGRKDFRWRFSILGALFVFLSLFIRELSATSVPALLAVLLFWHHERDNVSIKFNWDWRRLLPYALAAAVYSGLYLRMSAHKVDYAYSNLISWKIDLAYVKGIFLLFLKWIGLDSSLYLGLFLPLLAGSMFMLALVKAGYLPVKTEAFQLVFGVLLLAPTLLLIPFLQHGTGSFTLQYLACMIIMSFLIEYMDNSGLSRSKKKASHIVLCIVFGLLWIVYALEARQKAENFCMDARITAEAVTLTAGELPPNGAVELAGFPVTSAYSFVSDIFISGRKDDIRFQLKAAADDGNNEGYLKYLQAGFAGAERNGVHKDVIVTKTMCTLGSQEAAISTQRQIKILKQPIRRYSLGYLLIEQMGGRGGIVRQKDYSGCEAFISKFFFGIRPQTLEKQLLSGIEYRIDRPWTTESPQP